MYIHVSYVYFNFCVNIVTRVVCCSVKSHQILFQEIQFNNNFERQLIIRVIIENCNSVHDYADKLFNHSFVLIEYSALEYLLIHLIKYII